MVLTKRNRRHGRDSRPTGCECLGPCRRARISLYVRPTQSATRRDQARRSPPASFDVGGPTPCAGARLPAGATPATPRATAARLGGHAGAEPRRELVDRRFKDRLVPERVAVAQSVARALARRVDAPLTRQCACHLWIPPVALVRSKTQSVYRGVLRSARRASFRAEGRARRLAMPARRLDRLGSTEC